MKNVCVVTGGGSGMGLETAKILGKSQVIVLTGRTVSKLDNAASELKSLGAEVVTFPCDTGKRDAVKELVNYAKTLGNIKTVIHAAGVSPHMTDGESIFRINALGTVNIDEEFAPSMQSGGVILNVSSMAGHMLPAGQEPVQLYKLYTEGEAVFMGAAKQMLSNVPAEQQAGTAYTISKNFVIWYTERAAVKYGKNGIRVVSISPGTFSTPMGEIEGDDAANFAKSGALGRVGDPVEIAKMMAFMVSDDCSYLTGVDVLYDGGVIAAMHSRA